jgi:hypothetical protein
MPPLENSPYRLLVEGTDDLHSVIHLLSRHGYDWDNPSILRPYVANEGSIDKILEALPVALTASYRRIGFLVDADSSLTDRWAQIRGRADRTGLILPATPQPDGTVVSGLRPGTRVGFWLMPDNSSPGSLEAFLSKLVPTDDPTWSYANEAATEARSRGAHCKEKDHGKSALHTWLAWQEDPGIPFGTALKAKVFAHDGEDAIRFVAWFRRLFVEP